MSWREESEKFSLSFNGKLHLNFWENHTEALVISKRLKLPWDDRTDTNLIARLRMHFYTSKSTLGSLKSVLNEFRGKSSLGAPE